MTFLTKHRCFALRTILLLGLAGFSNQGICQNDKIADKPAHRLRIDVNVGGENVPVQVLFGEVDSGSVDKTLEHLKKLAPGERSIDLLTTASNHKAAEQLLAHAKKAGLEPNLYQLPEQTYKRQFKDSFGKRVKKKWRDYWKDVYVTPDAQTKRASWYLGIITTPFRFLIWMGAGLPATVAAPMALMQGVYSVLFARHIFTFNNAVTYMGYFKHFFGRREVPEELRPKDLGKIDRQEVARHKSWQKFYVSSIYWLRRIAFSAAASEFFFAIKALAMGPEYLLSWGAQSKILGTLLLGTASGAVLANSMEARLKPRTLVRVYFWTSIVFSLIGLAAQNGWEGVTFYESGTFNVGISTLLVALGPLAVAAEISFKPFRTLWERLLRPGWLKARSFFYRNNFRYQAKDQGTKIIHEVVDFNSGKKLTAEEKRSGRQGNNEDFPLCP